MMIRALDRMMVRRAGLDFWALAVVVSVGVLLMLLAPDYAYDDALITLRYARHLVEGHGIVWNPGDDPIEGYTNFLHLLLGSAALASSLEPLSVLRWFNQAALVAAGLCGASYVRFLGASAVERVGVAALIVLHPALHLWAASGLETASTAALVLIATWSVFVAPATVRRFSWLFWLAAALSRTEVVVLVIVTAITAVGFELGGKGTLKQRVARTARAHGPWIFVFGVLYGAYLIWRVGYFGFLLPTSAHYKALNVNPGRIPAEFAGHIAVVLLVATQAPFRRHGAALVVLALQALGYFVVFWNVRNSITPLHRFMLPIYPAIAVLAGTAVARMRSPHHPRAGLRIVALAAMLGWNWLSPGAGWAVARRTQRASRALILGRITTAARLQEHFRPEARILIGDVGAVGYVLQNPIDDLFGLNSEALFHEFEGNTTKYVASLWSKQPDGIVLASKRSDVFVERFDGDGKIAERKAFKDRYQKIASIQATRNYHFLVHARRGSPRLRGAEKMPEISIPADADVATVLERLRDRAR